MTTIPYWKHVMLTPPEQLEAVEVAREIEATDIREITPNWHPDIEEWWKGLDPPVDISHPDFNPPYCAVFVQNVTDKACERLGVTNPLNDVKREAYVPDYVSWARETGTLLDPSENLVLPGDAIVFSFGGVRYDHIGIVSQRLTPDTVATVEANTSPGAGDPASQREGQGIYRRTRRLDQFKARVIRWSHAKWS